MAVPVIAMTEALTISTIDDPASQRLGRGAPEIGPASDRIDHRLAAEHQCYEGQRLQSWQRHMQGKLTHSQDASAKHQERKPQDKADDRQLTGLALSS